MIWFDEKKFQVFPASGKGLDFSFSKGIHKFPKSIFTTGKGAENTKNV
ncbi:MAG: hypothetical protein ACR2N3_09710 [Pyrinomonadaceae bacterium]